MSTKIHLEGMGLQGALAAWYLWHRGIEFTWHDIDAKHRAWEASSGLIYPTGDARDMRAYNEWERWFANGGWWNHSTPRLTNILSCNSFWFATKSPPNGARYSIVADLGAIRCAGVPAYNFDVPAFVLGTRECFASQRRVLGERHDDSLYVVTHGFSQRLDHTVWGWTAHVQLDVHHSVWDNTPVGRPNLYLRVGRFRFGYANVHPGIPDEWIGGSAHIVQRMPHDLQVDGKMAKWASFVEETTDGLVKVTAMSQPIIGWRPAPSPDDIFPIGVRYNVATRTMYFPAMEGNGVRLAPLVLSSFERQLKDAGIL